MRKLFTLVFALSVFSYTSISQNGGINITGTAKVRLATGTYLLMDGDLKISVEKGLIIPESTFVTTSGDLDLDAPLAIVVRSNDLGRGSYIVNGDVNHSGNGSMKVQSYISGSAGTNYFMHFVGAPIEDTTVGYNKSVRLQQFDMTYLDTYAFEWDATVDTTSGQPWVNVWPYPYEVPVGNGLTLSNYVAGTGTIVMTGYPVSGDVSYNIRHYINNHLELIANPFPSAIDFDAFATNNNTYIQNKYWIYDPTSGNYITRASGIGGSQYIQHGQGMFIETKANGSITFTDAYKTHSDAAFRDVKPNLLSIHVEGGTIGFKDDLYIHFSEQGTSGFDEEIDAKKWNSVCELATMIRTIADDGTELAINTLPISRLSSELVTVPVHFECGVSTTYIFTFDGLESFDLGTEIWIEDLATKSDWIYIPESLTTFTFNASPGEEKHRFNIHFFGPTGIPDENPASDYDSIKIYASKQYAYISNNSSETIKEINIYNMMGNLLIKVKGTPQTLFKQYVSDQSGYYVVRVLTDKNVYTQKILILK